MIKDNSNSGAQPIMKNTTCPYCGVGCGVTAKVQDDKIISVSGREDHPANKGRLCVKGSALHETLSLSNRLLKPEINGRACDWDEALNYIANKWKTIIAEHGPDSVAFYLSGQLLTEDYYVANKLIKGFIGTSNVDTNSRLCMASAVVAHKRAFGSDAVPACYEDLELCDALFAVGSNAAYAHPILFQRIVKAKKEKGLKLVVVDPRRTATCEAADLHVPLRPGSDAYFYNGLLTYLAQNNFLDKSYINSTCDGFDETLEAASNQVPNLQTAAKLCDVSESIVQEAYDIFAQNEKVISLFSQGINQSTSGVDKGNSIINCHLATAKIGKPGSAPFSITGQPNAMGGREVGGLANQFAAHMGFTKDAIKRVEKFWSAPNISKQEGLKAVDMFEAVNSGKIKSIWIMATNPVVSMPNADFIKKALQKCDLVVVSDCMSDTDTMQAANIKLPATSWSEKQGTVTNSERCISLQKGISMAPGDARNDWEIICDFAKKMGYQNAFDYTHPVEIFREHAKLSGLENKNTRAFDISGLEEISKQEYEELTPTYWPINQSNPKGKKRLFSDGHFYTPNNRAQFIPIDAKLPKVLPQKREYTLNTGRIRDQWHTMTRTGKAPRLLNHTLEPFVQIHPEDALEIGIAENSLLKLQNPLNEGATFIGRAVVSKSQRRHEIFVPMHWNRVYASNSRADSLVNAFVDPISGQPEFKQSPVTAEPYDAEFEAILISEKEITPESDYWVKIPADEGFAYHLSDNRKTPNWSQWLQEAYPHISDWVSLEHSSSAGRILGFVDDNLHVGLYVKEASSEFSDLSWFTKNIGKVFSGSERFRLLAGRSSGRTNDCGKVICSCFQVGEKTIIEGIKSGLNSTEALGESLKCGTNCGSCIPELSAIIADIKNP